MLATFLLHSLLVLANFNNNNKLSIWETLRKFAKSSDPDFRALSSILQANCQNSSLPFLLQLLNDTNFSNERNNKNRGITLFAPTDHAFRSFFSDQNLVMYRGQRCRIDFFNTTCNLDNIFKYNRQPKEIFPCIDSLLRYHIIPNRTVYLLEDMDGVERVMTPLKTLFFFKHTNKSIQQQQIIFLNQTQYDEKKIDWLEFGVNRTMIIRKNIICSNGIIHAIDRILVPPSNFTTTVNRLNLAFVNDIPSGSNITVFLPSEIPLSPSTPEKIISDSHLLNLTDYTIKGIHYNANSLISIGSRPSIKIETTNLAGEALNITFGRDYNMTVNGIQVTRSNILFDTGVLHLIERPFKPLQDSSKNRERDEI